MYFFKADVIKMNVISLCLGTDLFKSKCTHLHTMQLVFHFAYSGPVCTTSSTAVSAIIVCQITL